MKLSMIPSPPMLAYMDGHCLSHPREHSPSVSGVLVSPLLLDASYLPTNAAQHH